MTDQPELDKSEKEDFAVMIFHSFVNVAWATGESGETDPVDEHHVFEKNFPVRVTDHYFEPIQSLVLTITAPKKFGLVVVQGEGDNEKIIGRVNADGHRQFDRNDFGNDPFTIKKDEQ